jgi:hypothetical protein
MKKEGFSLGTIRIGKDLSIYEKTNSSWKKQRQKNKEFPNLFEVIKLFKANGNFSELIDKKDVKFLKGQLSPEGMPQGARINILPDGKKLDGAYSLFSKDLTIHDQNSDSHWDVIYKNPNGKFAYHYTLDKKDKATEDKYKNVKEFEKKYNLLGKNVLKSLQDEEDYMILPMYTLLKTYMRIGNEIYYKAHKSKGLTTLKKSDLKINGNLVSFKYLSKGGVPINMIKTFPEVYIKRLKKILLNKKKEDFIFKNPEGNLLNENDFKKAFKKYMGEEFYPHIVRSYFATKQTENFLQKHKSPKKEEVRSFLLSVAEELGHKKFSKKTDQWEDSYSVTISHYIKPKLVEKLRSFC